MHPGADEDCSDGVDNDCDGLLDCEQASCLTACSESDCEDGETYSHAALDMNDDGVPEFYGGDLDRLYRVDLDATGEVTPSDHLALTGAPTLMEACDTDGDGRKELVSARHGWGEEEHLAFATDRMVGREGWAEEGVMIVLTSLNELE